MTTALTLEELDAHLKAKKRVYYVQLKPLPSEPRLGIVDPSHTQSSLSPFYCNYSFYSNYFHAYAHFLKLKQKDIKSESCSAI